MNWAVYVPLLIVLYLLLKIRRAEADRVKMIRHHHRIDHMMLEWGATPQGMRTHHRLVCACGMMSPWYITAGMCHSWHGEHLDVELDRPADEEIDPWKR